ncbi:hypothetical protein B0H15DRAFT_851495 [Mycena belliarum]|uniref:Uncharacterized protein n=1 Tax=Mycena belliarum TaxID=1033014 RepID=A0AAD6U236_9AGAR|nr:hypothetical protein B0H15DRAFT_851495 [Mycena belliae]
MLQTPSSVFSLVSLSSKAFFGLCAGVFIDSKVVFTQLVMSIPENSLNATRTTASVLLPTECAPAIPSISVFCTAVASYVAIIFTAVLCILCAEGSRRAATGRQPPSPPPSISSRCDATKKRRWTWLWWLIILLGILVLGLATFYKRFSAEEDYKTRCIEGLAFLERSFSDGLLSIASFLSALKLHLSLHGQHYLRSILLALASHSVWVFIALVSHRFRRYAVNLCERYWLSTPVWLVSPLLIASFSGLNWTFWLPWYWACTRTHSLPDVLGIQETVFRFISEFSFLAGYGPNSVALLIGPSLIHASILSIWTILLAILKIPRTARAVMATLRELYEKSLLRVLLAASVCTVTSYLTYCSIRFSWNQYHMLPPETQQAVWRWFSCPQSKAEVQRTYWVLVGEFRQWKSTQIADFPVLVSVLWELFLTRIKLCAQTWGMLCLGHRLLIVVPALIFYTCFFVIPLGRKIRIWCRRRRR